jgi:predicted nucleic acid-binding protein
LFSCASSQPTTKQAPTTPTQPKVPDITEAVVKSVEEAFKFVSPNSRIAVVHFSSPNADLNEFLLNEYQHVLVNKRFRVVDRSELDKLRDEHKLQISGDVDDNTAVSIGKFVGADVIVTGSIDKIVVDTARRLRLKVINTETADIIGTASEPFTTTINLNPTTVTQTPTQPTPVTTPRPPTPTPTPTPTPMPMPTPTPTPTPTPRQTLSATIDRYWVDFDVTESGEKGMRVHTKFNVNGMLNKTGQVYVYFYDSDNSLLKYNDRLVSAYEDFKPGYVNAVYNDFTVFVPYSKFSFLGSGEHDLRFDVTIHDDDANILIESAKYEFTYTLPGNNKNTPITASIDKVWVDHNQFVGSDKGMKIHTKFDVNGMLNQRGQVQAFFYNSAGSFLYRGNDMISVMEYFTPGYVNAVYNDFVIFIPYSRFSFLGKGRKDLKFDITIFDSDLNILTESVKYDFYITF